MLSLDGDSFQSVVGLSGIVLSSVLPGFDVFLFFYRLLLALKAESSSF